MEVYMEQFHNSGLWKLQNFYLVPQFTFGKVDPNFRSVWRRGGFAKMGEKKKEFWCLYMQPDKMYSSKVSKLSYLKSWKKGFCLMAEALSIILTIQHNKWFKEQV